MVLVVAPPCVLIDVLAMLLSFEWVVGARLGVLLVSFERAAPVLEMVLVMWEPVTGATMPVPVPLVKLLVPVPVPPVPLLVPSTEFAADPL